MTIAYSDKFKSWTSKYSFEPTCYSNIGGELISFNDNGSVWLHDSNNEMCSFYGDSSGAYLEVSSNQDPSAIKMFKSVSVETSGEGWTGEVFTNDEYEGNEKQEGDIKASFFKNKEGFKYAEMPRSKINSSVVIPAGKLNGFADGSDTSGTIYKPLFDSLLEQFDENYVLIGQYVIASFAENTAVSEIEFSLPGLFMPDFIQPNTSVSYVSASGETETLDKVKFVRATRDEITLSCKITPPGDDDDDSFNFFENEGVILSADLVNYLGGSLYQISVSEGLTFMDSDTGLFSFQDSEINGDQMRGPYARIKLSTATTKPFELHAVNVDYQFSKLDSRLNQNS